MAKRILVPLHDAADADPVLPLVADLARATGATVRLLHVAPYYPTRVLMDDRVKLYAHQQEEREAAAAVEWLRGLEPTVDSVAVEYRVRVGEPVEEILLEADAFDADLVVLRASRPRWWRRALGRVPRGVRARSRVPVLLLGEAA